MGAGGSLCTAKDSTFKWAAKLPTATTVAVFVAINDKGCFTVRVVLGAVPLRLRSAPWAFLGALLSARRCPTLQLLLLKSGGCLLRAACYKGRARAPGRQDRRLKSVCPFCKASFYTLIKRDSPTKAVGAPFPDQSCRGSLPNRYALRSDPDLIALRIRGSPYGHLVTHIVHSFVICRFRKRRSGY